MARRRLQPDERRAEVVATASQAIAEVGYRALSMSEIARRCGMSTPGLMHYFADMPSILAAVLDHRDEVDIAAILDDAGPEATLLDALESARRYYTARASEANRFDALEIEALQPGHPAAEYFRVHNEGNLARLHVLAAREFANPDEVSRLLRLLLDGLRIERVRGRESSQLEQDWRLIMAVIDGCRRR